MRYQVDISLECHLIFRNTHLSLRTEACKVMNSQPHTHLRSTMHTLDFYLRKASQDTLSHRNVLYWVLNGTQRSVMEVKQVTT